MTRQALAPAGQLLVDEFNEMAAMQAKVDLGALETARYIKVVDDTTGDLRPATDGYDLDAVEVLTGCA